MRFRPPLQSLDLDPRGHFVYALWDSKLAETPVYVGRSSSVFARLGQHLAPGNLGGEIVRVTIDECSSADAAAAVELAQITLCDPVLNVAGRELGWRSAADIERERAKWLCNHRARIA
jgi:hypothetical protein